MIENRLLPGGELRLPPGFSPALVTAALDAGIEPGAIPIRSRRNVASWCLVGGSKL